MLKGLGYWSGYGAPAGYINPKYLRGEYTQNEKEQIAKYLLKGNKVNFQLGYAINRINPAQGGAFMGCAEITDGTYIWPEGLWIYVYYYDVRLPAYFLNHINESNALDKTTCGDLSTVNWDYSQWIGWCKKNRPNLLGVICCSFSKDSQILNEKEVLEVRLKLLN
ncbi:hypothetical protein SAMN02745181_3590 [Rubritalea squalenifaciens DSM 18772]|uniref:Uncharacterized protein n=1 Tax=Rubritalea squalenifaciens DSM 18772 TaxID=1123071 RepID=A0A1M6RAQ2_9BACT|nr:hypothetical protein [Rubritalea squalenifaciens]SHK29522.1 hypothetical protein SAMN02745181_3590 [Rubritalea squalenifaciens DSM 18772]